jgi:hypothetical protein
MRHLLAGAKLTPAGSFVIRPEIGRKIVDGIFTRAKVSIPRLG